MAQGQPNKPAMQNQKHTKTNPSDSVYPELNLGLSLGEIYTEKPNQKPLARSSTVAGVITLEETKTTPQTAVSFPPQTAVSVPPQLSRSSSVPAKTGPRTIRHKDILALRRLETKKRLAERQKTENVAVLDEKTQPPAAPTSPPPEDSPFGNTVYRFQTEGIITVSALNAVGSNCATGITTSFETLPADIKPVITADKIKAEDGLESPPKRVKVSNGNVPDNDGEDGTAKARKLPRVRLRTTGADGRKIEGLLYQYRQGQVIITCVCHGSTLSPAEFVRHAGGSEVANPMRHIMVCSISEDD